jgi:ureidoglycolate lyase
MKIKVEKLTEKAFATYGKILGKTDSRTPDIQDAISDVWLGVSDLMQIGTRGNPVTYLRIHARPERYDTIERHLTSAEAFIPLEGKGILLVGPADNIKPLNPNDLRAFYMDGSCGVLFPKGTWHAVPYKMSDILSFLVLVDDVSIKNGDIDKKTIDNVEFDMSGLKM